MRSLHARIRQAAFWLPVLVGCGALAEGPAPPPASGERASTPPAAKPASTPEPTVEVTPETLLAREDPLWWLVPAETAGAACRPFVAEPYTVEGTGVLEPAEPDDNRPEGGERGPASGPAGPDPWRRISFEWRLQDDLLVLDTPRTRVGGDRPLVGSCQRVLPVGDLPWYDSAESCERARASRSPLRLGDCDAALRATVSADHGSERFSRMAKRGGTVHELARDGEAIRCRAWDVVPPRDGAPKGTLRRTSRNGRVVVETSQEYELDGAVLRLTSPVSRSVDEGDDSGAIGMGVVATLCAEAYLIQQPAPELMMLAGSRWYFERSDCEHASRTLPDVVALRGC